MTPQLFQLLLPSWKALRYFCISDIISDNHCILLGKCGKNETIIDLFPLVSFFCFVIRYDEGEFNS